MSDQPADLEEFIRNHWVSSPGPIAIYPPRPPKPWFVGRGVILWHRSDFVPRGVPSRGFATDYRDGMVEVIGLDGPRILNDFATAYCPEAGQRMWVPWMMLGGIETVDDATLAQWEAECGVKVPRPGTRED